MGKVSLEALVRELQAKGVVSNDPRKEVGEIFEGFSDLIDQIAQECGQFHNEEFRPNEELATWVAAFLVAAYRLGEASAKGAQ